MPLLPSDLARLKAVRERALRDAEAYVRARLWLLEERAVNALYQAYLTVYGEISARLFTLAAQYGAGETWSASDLAFRIRTDALMAQIAADVERLMAESADLALREAVRGYQTGYYGSAWGLEQGLRAGTAVGLPLLPAEAIRAAILLPYAGSTFVDRFADARDEFLRRVRRALVESQIAGESIYQAQQRLARELGIDIGRRTQAARAANKAYFHRTEMIARTEILRAANQGALAIYEANADVLRDVFEILTAKDERVCLICGPLDGQKFSFKSGSVPPFHPQCRCSIMPVLQDEALELAIVGKRQTYTEWAAGRGVSIVNDGGVLRYERGAPPPKSPSAAAKQTARGA